MKKVRVVSHKNLPMGFPVFRTITVALALDYWNAPAWLVGAVTTFMVIYWIASIKKIVESEEVEIFKDKEVDL